MKLDGNKPIIAVVTATGVQGRSVCGAFHGSGRWAVRALTRNPSGPVARKYAEEGIEVVQADFENVNDLQRAFEGVYAVYCVTLPPWDTGYGNKLSEYEQGVMQVNAAIASKVQLLLWSTLPYIGPKYMQMGGCELYDSKSRVEEYIKSCRLASVFISTAVFAENIYTWPLIRWIYGGRRLEFWHYVLDAETTVPFLWVERDLGPSILILVDDFRTFASNTGSALVDHPLNHTIQPIASWRATYGDISRMIEKLTGIPVQHTIHPNVDERWHYDLTKAFVYQNSHGLYPSHTFPPPIFLSLGASFSTLEQFVACRVIPLFGPGAQELHVRQSHTLELLEQARL